MLALAALAACFGHQATAGNSSDRSRVSPLHQADNVSTAPGANPTTSITKEKQGGEDCNSVRNAPLLLRRSLTSVPGARKSLRVREQAPSPSSNGLALVLIDCTQQAACTSSDAQPTSQALQTTPIEFASAPTAPRFTARQQCAAPSGFVAVDIAGLQALTAALGRSATHGLLLRLAIAIDELCVQHGLQRMHMSGAKLPVILRSSAPREGQEVPSADAANLLVFSARLLNAVSEVDSVPQRLGALLPLRIGIFTGAHDRLAHGSKSPVAGMKALALFAALGAVKLARSADTGRIQVCERTCALLVSGGHCPAHHWQAAPAKVKLPLQRHAPLRTFHWVPPPSDQPTAYTIASPGDTPLAEHSAAVATTSGPAVWPGASMATDSTVASGPAVGRRLGAGSGPATALHVPQRSCYSAFGGSMPTPAATGAQATWTAAAAPSHGIPTRRAASVSGQHPTLSSISCTSGAVAEATIAPHNPSCLAKAAGLGAAAPDYRCSPRFSHLLGHTVARRACGNRRLRRLHTSVVTLGSSAESNPSAPTTPAIAVIPAHPITSSTPTTPATPAAPAAMLADSLPGSAPQLSVAVMAKRQRHPSGPTYFSAEAPYHSAAFSQPCPTGCLSDPNGGVTFRNASVAFPAESFPSSACAIDSDTHAAPHAAGRSERPAGCVSLTVRIAVHDLDADSSSPASSCSPLGPVPHGTSAAARARRSLDMATDGASVVRQADSCVAAVNAVLAGGGSQGGCDRELFGAVASPTGVTSLLGLLRHAHAST